MLRGPGPYGPGPLSIPAGISPKTLEIGGAKRNRAEHKWLDDHAPRGPIPRDARG